MSLRPTLASPEELWRIVDDAGVAPAKGWSLYSARFRRERSVMRGGVRWEVLHTLEASSERFFSTLEITPVPRPSSAIERKLRANEVFGRFNQSAHRSGHRGGWWLGADGVSGHWLEELYSPERALTARDALERVLAKRRPSAFANRPPIRQVIPRTGTLMGARIWTFLQLMRGTPDWAQSFVAIGYHRRARLTVNGRRWLTLRVAWVVDEGTESALMLEPEGESLALAERRRIGAAIARAGFPMSWHRLQRGWSGIASDGPDPGVALTDAIRRLDEAALARLLR